MEIETGREKPGVKSSTPRSKNTSPGIKRSKPTSPASVKEAAEGVIDADGGVHKTLEKTRNVSRVVENSAPLPSPARTTVEAVARGSREGDRDGDGDGDAKQVGDGEAGEPERSANGGRLSEDVNGAGVSHGGSGSGDKKTLKLKARAKRLAAESEERHRKRGVCYLSRVPPHLKPLKLRHMLSQYGGILRIYLAPEDAAIRLRRKRSGGNSGKNFTEGWVEFERKAVAKRVADLLNGQQMGGKKRSAYHFDLWNIKYLSKFKWDNLTEEIAFRNAARDQKLAAEISAAKKERDFYLSKVDQSRAIAAMTERKRKRAGSDTSTEAKRPAGEASAVAGKAVLRRFKQTEVVEDPSGEEAKQSLPRSLLGKVFGRKDKKLVE